MYDLTSKDIIDLVGPRPGSRCNICGTEITQNNIGATIEFSYTTLFECKVCAK